MRTAGTALLIATALLAGGCGSASSGADSTSSAYRESKDLCAVFSAAEVAREYGGDPTDLASVANAYAESSYRADFHRDAEAGCLAGLKE